MRAVRWLVWALVSAGCAVGAEDSPGPRVGAADSSGGDISVPDVTSDVSPGDAADASTGDTGPLDTGGPDGTWVDSGGVDTTVDSPTDVGADTSTTDSAVDTGTPDTGAVDTGTPDTGTPDTGTVDTGTVDSGPVDTGPDASCPVLGCATGTESKDGCKNARTIGRTVAGSTAGFSTSDSTCYAYDRFDDSTSCWDANSDHTYKIWMRASETIAIDLSTSWPCPTSSAFSWYATLKIFENAGCGDTACTTKSVCVDNKTAHKRSFVAPRDGWYVLVVDGSSAFDDAGDYTLKVKLACSAPGCGC